MIFFTFGLSKNNFGHRRGRSIFGFKKKLQKITYCSHKFLIFHEKQETLVICRSVSKLDHFLKLEMKYSRSKTIFQIFGRCNRCELWFRYFVWVKTSITMMNIIKIIHGPSWIVFILRIYDFFKLDHKECKSRCNSECLGIKKTRLNWLIE